MSPTVIKRFLRFVVVGTAGYLVNLAAYALVLHVVGAPYLAAASVSFAFAVTHNYLLNRAWTFADAKGAFFGQGARFLVVSLLALATNLAVLHILVVAGAGELLAQAIAVVVALPINFIGNVLWSFRHTPEVEVEARARVHAPTAGPAAPRAVVCLPTYNERENLEAMLLALDRVLVSGDLVVVIDDNSRMEPASSPTSLPAGSGSCTSFTAPRRKGWGRRISRAFATRSASARTASSRWIATSRTIRATCRA